MSWQDGMIEYSIVWTIPTGKTDEFKTLASEAIEISRNESPVKEYRWFFNEDETRCGLIERYPGPEAIVEHLKLVGGVLAKMLEIGRISRFDVLGSLDEKTRNMVEKMGARVYTPWDGFKK